MKIGAIGIRTKIIVGDAATWYLVKKYIDGKIIDLATDYETLNDKPKINDVELSGNKTSEDLGLVSAVEGKSLVDDTEIEKLAGIEENANNYILPSDVVQDASYVHTDNNFTDSLFITLSNQSGVNTGDQDLSGLVEKKANHSLVPDLEIEKLAGIEENANNYTHPETHPSSIITQDANNRFVTDAEKTTWNAKASTDVATTSVAGLMSSSDKTKLDGIATGANNYTHPETHPSSILNVVDVVNGDVNKFLNERGEMVAVAHESLTDKNSEAAFQHIDTTTTKTTLDAADMVAIKDSVTGKVVLTPKSNFEVKKDNWVGVEIDPSLSSSEPAPKSTVVAFRATELKRVGNLYYHTFGNSRICNAIRPAIVVRATRQIAWYLDKNNPSLKSDGTASNPDWTIHNICIITPDIYRRVRVLNSITGRYELAMDIEPFEGATLYYPETAHSVGFATVDRTNNQLVSVMSQDARFRGGNNNAAADLLPSSQLGKPASNISRINFENYAANAGWETGNILDRTLWHELTALYFANTNIQLDYSVALTAEGYPQGGLGAGVTNWNSARWSYRNGYFPIHNIGEGFMSVGCNAGVKNMVDEKYYVGAISAVSAGNLVANGNFAAGAGWLAGYIGKTVQNLQTLAEATITGKTDDNTLTLSADIFTAAGQWYWIKDVTYSYQIPVFFGLEHLYGEIWDWVSGVNIEKSAEVVNGGTGESKAYVCLDFSKRATTITPDYSLVGLVPRNDGYIKELYRNYAISKSNTGAGSTTFMSDYGYYGGIPATGSNVYGLLFGAAAHLGVNAGVRTSNALIVPANAYAYFGARLRAKIEKA